MKFKWELQKTFIFSHYPFSWNEEMFKVVCLKYIFIYFNLFKMKWQSNFLFFWIFNVFIFIAVEWNNIYNGFGVNLYGQLILCIYCSQQYNVYWLIFNYNTWNIFKTGSLCLKFRLKGWNGRFHKYRLIWLEWLTWLAKLDRDAIKLILTKLDQIYCL